MPCEQQHRTLCQHLRRGVQDALGFGIHELTDQVIFGCATTVGQQGLEVADDLQQAGLRPANLFQRGAWRADEGGQIGEILVRGPNVMCAYWQDADNPAFAQGWFHTGDLARCDVAGFYEVVGRSKDMIISGGENVYPAEIENLLADCPKILEAAVVGQPDARWGEVVVAFIVKVPGADLDAAQVLQLFEGRLARFKHPKHIVICEALPKTALGKVQKAGLLAGLADQ